MQQADKPRLPRVFLGLRETAGYYQNLKSGLDELGVPCTYADLSANPGLYATDHRWWSRAAAIIANRRRSSTSGLRRAFWRALQVGLSVAVLAWAIPRHDVFIIGSPQAILVRTAYPALRMSKKVVISVLHGSDSRPPYMNAKVVGEHGPINARAVAALARSVRTEVRRIERWSSAVVSHPPSSQYLMHDFVDYLSIGVPFRTRQVPPHQRAGHARVLHAPSHLSAKGTAVIRDAISAMTKAGTAIAYVEIHGRPNAEVLSELTRADIAIDQAYSDQPMPGFATEASGFGIPVVIGSCDWKTALAGNLDPPPTVRCAPEEIGQAVRRLVENEELRLQSGMAAQTYVKDRWAPQHVAARYLRLAAGDRPAEWMRGPRDVTYVYGVGLSRARVLEVAAHLAATCGVSSLGLDDRPELLNTLLQSRRPTTQTS